MIRCDIFVRLPANEKQYYTYWLNKFCELFDDKDLLAIQFGKQDIRGTESITFVDKKHCVPAQKHFSNKWEMLGYAVGAAQWADSWEFKDFRK